MLYLELWWLKRDTQSFHWSLYQQMRVLGIGDIGTTALENRFFVRDLCSCFHVKVTNSPFADIFCHSFYCALKNKTILSPSTWVFEILYKCWKFSVGAKKSFFLKWPDLFFKFPKSKQRWHQKRPRQSISWPDRFFLKRWNNFFGLRLNANILSDLVKWMTI